MNATPQGNTIIPISHEPKAQPIKGFYFVSSDSFLTSDSLHWVVWKQNAVVISWVIYQLRTYKVCCSGRKEKRKKSLLLSPQKKGKTRFTVKVTPCLGKRWLWSRSMPTSLQSDISLISLNLNGNPVNFLSNIPSFFSERSWLSSVKRQVKATGHIL